MQSSRRLAVQSQIANDRGLSELRSGRLGKLSRNMPNKKAIENILSSLRTVGGSSPEVHPSGKFEHLTDESVLRLYESIRRQVDADKALGDKYRLVGLAAKERAERLREELLRRGVKFSPIAW